MLIIIWLWKDVGSSLGESFCEKVGFALCSKYSWSWVQSLPCRKASHKWRCFTSFPSGLSNNRVGLRGGGEECFVWVFFLMTKVVLLASKWMVQKKEQTFKVFKRFLNGTWCMPRYGRKCFLVMSGFRETFLLKEVVTGKPEVTQSTQSPCLSFPLQCNGLASCEDRYFGNHSAMSEFISKCYSYTESTSRRGAPTHLPQCLETYYK